MWCCSGLLYFCTRWEYFGSLSNFDFRHFKTENRVAVTLESLKFSVLDELFAEGEKYIATIEAERAKHRKRALDSADKAGKKHKTAVK